MKVCMLLALITFTAHAQTQVTIDQQLQGYISEFNLTPLRAPSPINKKLFVLGRELFFEKALSGNNNISCAECHHPRVMTHDALPLGLGEGAKGLEVGQMKRMQLTGKVLARNTPALFNLHNVHTLFWDGRVEFDPEAGTFTTPVKLPEYISTVLSSALAAQAIFPLVNHEEMRGQRGSNAIADAKDEVSAWALLVKKILALPKYQELFKASFPNTTINIGHLGEALAHFQSQAFFFSDTPYDRYLQGDQSALTLKQKQGMEIFFNKGRCGDCHQGEHLSALDFDSVGVPQIGPGVTDRDDLGRYQWDQDPESRYAFRVPPLRNVAMTAPYMHNGVFQTLAQVVEHYDDIASSLMSYQLMQTLINYLRPLEQHDSSTNELRLSLLPADLALKIGFTEEEEEALVEFLQVGLTDVRLR
jgi:cytochrome c peroxidase